MTALARWSSSEPKARVSRPHPRDTARRRHAYRDLACALTLAASLLLTACTAQIAPTPSPTTPPLAALTLTPAGLGPLGVGKPVPTATPLIHYGPHTCPSFGGWLPQYPQTTDVSSGQQLNPFDVITDDHSRAGAITAIYVWSRLIATPGGIRVGDSQARVIAAYPTAKVSESYSTFLYMVTGTSGRLVIEVAARNAFAQGEWPKNELGTVVWMFALPLTAKVKSIAGNDDAGPCPVKGDNPGGIDND